MSFTLLVTIILSFFLSIFVRKMKERPPKVKKEKVPKIKKEKEILEVVEEVGRDGLKLIKDKLSSNITYHEIQVVLAKLS